MNEEQVVDTITKVFIGFDIAFAIVFTLGIIALMIYGVYKFLDWWWFR